MSTNDADNSIFESKIHVENKDVFVDVKNNANGVYLKISERNRNMRSTILIPASGIESLRDVLTAALDTVNSNKSSAAKSKNSSSKSTGSNAKPNKPNAKDTSNRVVDETRLYMSQLSWNLDSEQLQALVGEHVPADKIVAAEVFTRKDGRSLGCATIQFKTAAATKDAIQKLNGLDIGGRVVITRECYVE